VDVGEAGKVGEEFGEAVGDGLLGEFDFAHVKRTNPRNLIPRMNHRRSPPLRPCQDNVDQIVGRWDGCHGFEVVDWHFVYYSLYSLLWYRSKR
jgi:hypothetical protein